MTTTTNQDREFISQVISSSLLEDSIEYIKNNFSAQDIYGEDVFTEWAEENGYSKEEW